MKQKESSVDFLNKVDLQLLQNNSLGQASSPCVTDGLYRPATRVEESTYTILPEFQALQFLGKKQKHRDLIY